MNTLTTLLDTYRHAAVSEREKGTYFEELVIAYLRNEATYKELYSDVWTYAQWAALQGIDQRDAGIDLVAKTRGTDELHAIQCKFYDAGYKIQKRDIDSFFTASGKRPFTHRVIVSTTSNWSEHAEEALRDQQPPVSKIGLHDLENSQIDWSLYQPKQQPVLLPKKQLRPHQQNALERVVAGLAHAERGKLIMACGTGKTFTSLKIAEALAGAGGRVLFLVPSLSLLSQTLTEWTQESAIPLHSFAVCSDSDVGKKRSADDDRVQTFTHELRYPATTQADRLADEIARRHDDEHMSVVFSTYHSIDVIHRAQHDFNLADFDLIVCDEAHRTTGASYEDEEESAFVRVHNPDFIRANKRLYMTATPRIYADVAKASAEQDNVALYSMDNEQHYGKELFVITFSEAVKRGLLVDYKVIVLAVEESHVHRRLQALLAGDDNSLKVDDAAKIVGCWKALSKQGINTDLHYDADPMKRAVAFCQVIAPNKKAKRHQVASMNIAEMFQDVVEAYQEAEAAENGELAITLNCEAEHVDGSMNASQKEEKLDWLKAETPENTCRILSNVRCLSEGVDVPALDAVLFLTPRNSQVDVVQSVGRVMRNAPNKRLGYVVLPVVIPANMEPHEALNDNQTYKVVWQVLQALRSHDDRFDAMVNKLDLIGQDTSKMEVIAITDKIQARKQPSTTKQKNKAQAKSSHSIGEATHVPEQFQNTLEFEIGEIERAIYAKLVDKVGNRHHWEDWAKDIAKIANTHIDRITAIIEAPENTKERAAFEAFAAELRDDINNSVSDAEIIEMLAQHLITQPVFEALFEGYSFAQNNPISKAMQQVLDALQEHHISKEADTLQRFYDSVKLRAEGIDSAIGKQRIIVELYDKFFRSAFPRMTDRLGIVYTPVEVVDFILHSVNDVLKAEFGQTLGSEGVHILDPFTGTGTFITRLLQSGLITPEQLPHKYRHEIHANEIVLLAYYIAAINIEAVYHSIAGGDYVPFEGICLTDTFQMQESEDLISKLLVDNSQRRERQKKLDIRVIVGNPPYSAGQTRANDNNANVAYPYLDERIRSTYADQSVATNKNALYDSYIRAIRWASDRIGNKGVIGFVSGNAWTERSFADGMRKCLAEEYSNIYVVNLRGDIRKNMLSKGAAKEGQNIFGSGSMTGVSIAVMVKNPEAIEHGQIFYRNIGDDLTRQEKLDVLTAYISIGQITESKDWVKISPDQHGDWLNQRDDSFEQFMLMGDKKDKTAAVLFENYSSGVKTQRDAWCYNASKQEVEENVKRLLATYQSELDRYNVACAGLPKDKWPELDSFLDFDPSKTSWSAGFKSNFLRKRLLTYSNQNSIPSLYRPFSKQWLYYDRDLNERVYQMPHIFPDAKADNLVICVSGKGARNAVSTFISNNLVDLNALEAGAQCFPLYLYDEKEHISATTLQPSLLGNDDKVESSANHEVQRRYALTDEGLEYFQKAYPTESISKEDVFYYIYGLLHSPDYRARYADNLAKELPRIPPVKEARDFWLFVKAGRDLADLHLNYETAAMYPATVDGATDEANYRVEKMRYGKGKDKSVIHYNGSITVRNIPLEAYDYVVNGKPAIDWVVERQGIREDKASGIVNDANDWATETMGNPRYPLELLLRVITVSLETMKIVHSLPALELQESE